MNKFYVSPEGSGDGHRGNPCSIDKVLELVSATNNATSGAMTSDITIYLEGGTYFMDHPIVIKNEHSGKNGFTVRWESAEDASPVLSGERAITDWEIHDAEKNIWKARVPENSDFEQLWQGHSRLVRANSGWNPSGFKNSRKGLKFSTSVSDIRHWKNSEDIVVTKRFMWRNMVAKVQKVARNEIQLDPAVLATYKVPSTALGVMEPFSLYGLLNTVAIRIAKFHIENAYELLTEEGEWYLDKAQSTVYFKPFDNDSFNSQSVLLYSGLKTFFLLDGTVEKPVSNIAIQGLRFCYSKGTKLGVTAGFPTEPTKCITPKPESAIQVNAGHNITLQDNCFLHMGYDAVHFDLCGKNINIIGNGFADISRSSISLNQTNLVLSSKSKKGVLPENENKFFDGIEIKNNYIRSSGVDGISPAVSYSEFTRNLRFTHNEVRDVSTQAIRNSWRHLGWRDHAGNIEYSWNKSSDVGRAGLEDFGAFYVSCANKGFTKIHHNYIDGVGLNPSNAGIYLDVFVDKAEIFNNVSINMPKGSWMPIPRAWVALVMSTNTQTYNNWADRLTLQDTDQGRYRYFWSDKSNKAYDNHLINDITRLPSGAQEVVDRAGVEPQYHQMKSYLDILTVKGDAA
ncbi:hypothetical protein A9Q99_21145 [Gammaproteobacteria bacterium 45_16_T64]|nr:hypothetical protein A9Q99_21145 [Gammaproteobacteria bacterium 45_16_T64]